MSSKASERNGDLILDGFLGNIESIGYFSIGHMLESTQSKYFLTPRRKLPRKIANDPLQLLHFELPIVDHLATVDPVFPAFKGHRPEFSFANFIGHFIFDRGLQVRSGIGNGPALSVFPHPYEHLLNHIHAYLAVPRNKKGRAVQFLPIPMKQCRECLSVSRSNILQQFIIPKCLVLIFHILLKLTNRSKNNKLFLTSTVYSKLTKFVHTDVPPQKWRNLLTPSILYRIIAAHLNYENSDD